jgi:hypothetical protein
VRNQRHKAPQAHPPARTWQMRAGSRRTSTGCMSPVEAPGRSDINRPGGHEEGLRRTRGWPLGHSWAPTLSSESVVNVGTVPVFPHRPASQVGGGKARRL